MKTFWKDLYMTVYYTLVAPLVLLMVGVRYKNTDYITESMNAIIEGLKTCRVKNLCRTQTGENYYDILISEKEGS